MLALSVFRKHAALSLLVAFSLYHAIVLVRSSLLAYLKSANSDPMYTIEREFEPLEIRLSHDRSTTVGYITDTPVATPDWAVEYLRTQYALAPIMLNDSSTAFFVVAHCRNASSCQALAADLGFSEIMDYGNGVYLLSRDEQ
jgi:hypothetical protein